MRFMTLSALASSWLFFAPALWDQRPAKAILAASIGLVTMALSPLGVIWSPARRAIALAGFLLALSNFALYDGLGVLANDAVVGLILVFAGLGPAPRSTVVAARSAVAEPAAIPAAPRMPEAERPIAA